MSWYSVLYSLFALQLAFPVRAEHIILNQHNFISIKGTITEKTADAFIYALYTQDPKYVYINSNGGSVMAGNRIITALQNKEVRCIAERAYSMAFAILQACQERYVLPTSTVMQHQMSLGIEGNLLAVSSYIDMLHQVEAEMAQMQAHKIGISKEKFNSLVNTDWWLFGHEILLQNVADDFVSVECDKDLVTKKVKVVKHGFFEDYEETYSMCPLIVNPLSSIAV